MDVSKVVTFANNRVFIDIAEGCGNGCIYCYTEKAKIEQIVFSGEDIENIYRYILHNDNFQQGKEGTLISLCPHTESFKNEDSIKMILLLIEKLNVLGNRIQIATKGNISKYFIEEIDKLKIEYGQLIIFISISSITNSEIYEPNALKVSERFENIRRLRYGNIANCIYIKPFLVRGEKEIKDIISIVDEYKPDCTCIGVKYDYNITGNHLHPTNKNISSYGFTSDMQFFCEEYKSRIPLFYTSSCVVSYINKIQNNRFVEDYLCTNCCLSCKGRSQCQN